MPNRTTAVPRLSPAETRTAGRRRPTLRGFAAVAIVAASALWLWSSLAALANFAFPYPMLDQFRLYRFYLGLPFPENAVQLENGHRPLLPALVRLAEIEWFSADQVLQIVVGAAAALAALGLIVATIARERNLPLLTRTAACALAALAIFWLGNARMLMHGNELVHTYFVVLSCGLALACIAAARHGRPARWTTLAGVCCLAATFSFGTGMASFGAVLGLGLILRLRARDLAIPGAMLLFALAVYLLGLPGNSDVRGTLLLDPAGNLAALARWLSAPWMRAWLGHADPSIEPWLQSSLLGSGAVGRTLVATARWIAAPFGTDPAMPLGATVGGLGIAGLLAALVHAWRHPQRLGAMRVLALGFALFGLGAAVIVCFARVSLFKIAPEQVFADRYLPWSCLFWLGLALYAIGGRWARSDGGSWAAATATLLAMLVLLPSHRALAGWSATVSRHVIQSAVAAQLGIWDARRFESAASTNEDVEITLRLLRERHLSMFGEPAYALVERGWHAPATLPPPLAGAVARVAREFDDPHSGRHVADIEGWMPRVDGARHPVLAVVDARGALRGLAQPSFIGPDKKSLRLNLAKKRGFDGYVLDAKPGETLHVLVLDDDTGTRVLANIPLRIPEPADGN